ncbi:zinc-binding dehydrogenase [Chryseobacterium sp.]|nr:hypothetical protein [Chryseobacterium sp.]
MIRSGIAKTYSFTSIAEAYQQVETRRSAGKIVLTM